MFEPMNPDYLGAIGFDMFTDPPRRTALQAALGSDEPQATARLLLGRVTGNARSRRPWVN